MTQLLFLALWVLVCLGAFVAGLRFYRMSEAPGAGVSADQAKRFGRLMMMAATAMLLFLGALVVRGELKVTA